MDLRSYGCSLMVVLASVLLLPGCAQLTGGKSGQTGDNNAWKKIEQPLRALRENFERRRLMQFSRGVHSDYRRYETELRDNLADVYRIYSSIQLEFFGTRATRSGNTIIASVNWNLRWTCQSPTSRAPSGCRSSSDVGNVIIRRGKTDLEFQYEGGKWKLINQQGDLIFGSLGPGSVR